MEYYRDGFHPGDPAVRPATAPPRSGLPDEVDVLVVGSGQAGLVAAAQLAQFPAISTAVIERRPEPFSSARPTASPAAPSRCSRRSASPGR